MGERIGGSEGGLRLLVTASLALALCSSCSFFLVRPVHEERAADGEVRPTCVTNSYLWPVLDAVLASALLVAPPLELKRTRDLCANGDEEACSSTDSLVLLYMTASPVAAISSYLGFTGARRCRDAGSRPRLEPFP